MKKYLIDVDPRQNLPGFLLVVVMVGFPILGQILRWAGVYGH